MTTPVPPKPKKPIYKRWWFIVLVVVFGLIWLGNAVGDPNTSTTDAAHTKDAASPSVTSEPTEAPTKSAEAKPSPDAPRLWSEAPTDGTWETGDISYGQPTEIAQGAYGPVGEHTFTISEPPTFTLAKGDQATMTSVLHVVRAHDRGFGNDISNEKIWFTPGGGDPPLSETYGTNTKLDCERMMLAEGESTTCNVSFTAPKDEMPNAFWTINGKKVGAWPGQLAR